MQPYIALCLGLKRWGHRTTIVTHEEYKAWIEGFGIEHRTAGGDPGMLMKLSVDNKVSWCARVGVCVVFVNGLVFCVDVLATVLQGEYQQRKCQTLPSSRTLLTIILVPQVARST